jgi:hypothetical protein
VNLRDWIYYEDSLTLFSTFFGLCSFIHGFSSAFWETVLISENSESSHRAWTSITPWLRIGEMEDRVYSSTPDVFQPLQGHIHGHLYIYLQCKSEWLTLQINRPINIYLFVVYFTTLSVSKDYIEYSTTLEGDNGIANWKGFGRKRPWPGTIPEFV